MGESVILVLDIGTTNIKCIAFDRRAAPISHHFRPVRRIPEGSPRIEYDPLAVWETARALLRESLEVHSRAHREVLCMGISSQRGSTILWDARTGLPETHALSWQDMRAGAICERIMQQDLGDLICERAGGPLLPMKSLAKILWLFENRPELRKKAQEGLLLFGNMDSWILWRLTGRKCHATDNTNASATQMVHLVDQEWDSELLAHLGIPRAILPALVPSCGFLDFTSSSECGREIPICSLIADQQASLFGQGCLTQGMAKCTYGTGSFVMVNTGDQVGPAAKAAWNIDGKVTYASEGYGGTTGLMLDWLYQEILGLEDISRSQTMAASVNDAAGVMIVPALSGLQAPFQDPRATGVILGLRVGVTKNHILRAFLESVGMLCRAILEDLQKSAALSIDRLRVDGAGAANDFLMQFQADILGIPVERARLRESTAAGAAFLAGMGAGFWQMEEIPGLWQRDRLFEPKMGRSERDRLFRKWMAAVNVSRAWGQAHGDADDAFFTRPNSLT